MSMNILDMSDEDLMKMSPDELEALEADSAGADNEPDSSEEQTDATDHQASEDGAEEVEEKAEDSADTNTASVEDEGEGQDGDAGAGDEGGNASKAPVEDPATDTGVAADAETNAETKPVESEAKEEKEAGTAAAEELEKIFAPFSANGKEMQVKNADEAIALMQMGANYNKKMAALKPNLKLLKLLETNGLLSEEKLSYLIDLSNKDVGAINKLVKDSGIDPMDLAAEKADEYKPTVRAVNEKELELDEVLDEIKQTPAYQRTLTVVGKEWDVQSREIVADTPQLLKIINSHVQSGIYDQIIAEVERERMFGRLQGVPDIAAYKQVGDAIQARGGFDRLGATGSTTGQQTSAASPVVVPPKLRTPDDSKLKDKRRAAASASSATSSAPSTTPKDFNPLAMSDEEFAKLVRPELM